MGVSYIVVSFTFVSPLQKYNTFSKKGDTFLLNLCIFRKKGYFFNENTINTKDLLTFVFIVHLTF